MAKNKVIEEEKETIPEVCLTVTLPMKSVSASDMDKKAFDAGIGYGSYLAGIIAALGSVGVEPNNALSFILNEKMAMIDSRTTKETAKIVKKNTEDLERERVIAKMRDEA